jgi:hypothetical protein
MTFYFSFPQTLIRQLSMGQLYHYEKYVFVFEKKGSGTGRNNHYNYLTSKKILSALLPDKKLSIYKNHRFAPKISKHDGVGDELLRNRNTRVYGWELIGEVNYIIQHSTLGWEGINLKILLHPFFFLRAYKRTYKRYRRVSYKRFIMYSGKKNIALRETLRPWKSIELILHESFLENIDKVLKFNPKIINLPKGLINQTKNNLLFLPTADYTYALNSTIHEKLERGQKIFFKAHPQQKTNKLGNFYSRKVIEIKDNSTPVEFYIRALKPKEIVGPKSSIYFFCEMPYAEYEPVSWTIHLEALVTSKFRNIIS